MNKSNADKTSNANKIKLGYITLIILISTLSNYVTYHFARFSLT